MDTTSLVIRIVLAAIFFMAGGAKLAGVQRMKDSFQTYGYPSWFRYFIGLSEIAGAIILLFRDVATIAAVGLIVIMIGAIVSHLRAKEYKQWPPAAVLLVLLVIVGAAEADRLGGPDSDAEAARVIELGVTHGPIG